MQELDAMLLHLTMAATLEIAAVAEMIDHADLAFWRKNHSVNRSTMQAIIASMLLADGSNDANKRGASAATRSTELSVVVWVGSIQEIPVNCAVLRAMPLEIGGDVPQTVDLT